MAKNIRLNMVIDGEYKGKLLGCFADRGIYIVTGLFKTLYLNKDNVEKYELVDEQKYGVGTDGQGVYAVLINFKDGKKSLIEIDGEYFSTLKRSLMYNVKL